MSDPNPFNDPAGAADAKAQGQTQVSDNQHEEWRDAILSVIESLARTRPAFTGDDVREEAARLKISEPKHSNAWGALMSTAVKGNIIKAVGYTTSKQTSRHGAVIRVWTAAPKEPQQ